jgi:copper chaperone CopZ
MKYAGILLLGLVGLALAGIAWRAESPTYRAPVVDPDPPAVVPHTLSGNVPAGRVVRTFDIEGICCNGCPGKLFVKLDQLEGVEEAAVDPVLKQAMVVVSPGYDVARVEEALTFGKYSATESE